MDREFKYTVKVKSYVPYNVDDVTINMIGKDKFEEILADFQECFWEAAKYTAQHYGYDDVWSEGCQGGWCTPVIKTAYRHYSVSQYIREGLNDEDIAELETEFDKFKADIEELLSIAEDDFKATIEDQYRYAVEDLKARQDAAIVRGDN